MSNGQHPPTKQPGPSLEAKLIVGVFGGTGLVMLLGAVTLLFTRGFSSFLGLALFGSVFAGIGWLVYRNFIAPPGMHWLFVDGEHGPESKLVEIGQDSATAQREHARQQAEPWTARDDWRTGMRGDKHPQAEFSVKLVCAKTVTTTYQAAGSGTGDAEKFRASRLLVWEQEHRLRGAPGADRRLQLDVAMDVPDNLPLSDEQRDGHRHQWLLRVESALPGRDYAAEFELPVFRRQTS